MQGLTPEARAIEQVRLELVTRRLSIMVLAFFAVWIGIAMILMGAPDFIEHWFSPWSRVAFGIVSFIGGLITMSGLLVGGPLLGWWLQVSGLATLGLWYAAMGTSYAALIIFQGSQFVRPGQELPDASTGRAYVPLIYLTLFLLAVIPLVTLLRLGRPSRVE